MKFFTCINRYDSRDPFHKMEIMVLMEVLFYGAAVWNHKIYWTVLQLNFTHLVHCFKKCTNNSFRRINASIYKQEMNWTCKSLYWVCKYTCINSSNMSHLVCFYIHSTMYLYEIFSPNISCQKNVRQLDLSGENLTQCCPSFLVFSGQKFITFVTQ